MTIIKGLDSETPEGEIALLCTEDGWIEPKTFDEVILFLLQGRESILYWTYNLRFDATAIIKLLPQELWRELWTEGEIAYKGYKVKYIPKKLFSIGKMDNRGWVRVSASLFDAAQYYMGNTLDNAAKKYLGKEKIKGNYGAKLGARGGMNYYKQHKAKIKKYCMLDAVLAKELGEYIVDKFSTLGFDASNPISPASISSKYIRAHYVYPQTDILPNAFHGIAQAAYRGGMFQTLQRGMFDFPLWDYDINSAYPYEMSKLPNWSNGRFEEVNSPTNAPYGWYMCKFNCPMIPYDSKQTWEFSYSVNEIELDYTAKNTRIFYPSGERVQAITKSEYDWMKSNGYMCEFLFGIEWHKEKDKYISPFAWMEDLYYTRQVEKAAGNFGIQYTMKIVLNGSYGKTVESKYGPGKLTNFFYGSYITAGTRLKVANVLHNHPKDIVNIATDGLVSTKEIPELTVSKKLGEWELNKYTKGMFLGSGMYQVWSEDGTYYTKARGVTDNRKWDMARAIRDNKNKSNLVFGKVRPLQLGEIITHHIKLKPEMLNHFVETGRKLDVNTDRNHRWYHTYKDFGEFMENEDFADALSIDEIKGFGGGK